MITVDMDRFISHHLPETVAQRELIPINPYSQQLTHSLWATPKFVAWAKEHQIQYEIYTTKDQAYVIEFDNLEDFTFYKLSW